MDVVMCCAKEQKMRWLLWLVIGCFVFSANANNTFYKKRHAAPSDRLFEQSISQKEFDALYLKNINRLFTCTYDNNSNSYVLLSVAESQSPSPLDIKNAGQAYGFITASSIKRLSTTSIRISYQGAEFNLINFDAPGTDNSRIECWAKRTPDPKTLIALKPCSSKSQFVSYLNQEFVYELNNCLPAIYFTNCDRIKAELLSNFIGEKITVTNVILPTDENRYYADSGSPVWYYDFNNLKIIFDKIPNLMAASLKSINTKEPGQIAVVAEISGFLEEEHEEYYILKNVKIENYKIIESNLIINNIPQKLVNNSAYKGIEGTIDVIENNTIFIYNMNKTSRTKIELHNSVASNLLPLLHVMSSGCYGDALCKVSLKAVPTEDTKVYKNGIITSWRMEKPSASFAGSRL